MPKESPQPKTRSLYHIDDDLLALEAQLVEQEGEADDTLLDDYLAALDDRDAKLDGYCALIREAEARASARKAEAKRLSDLKRSDESLVKRLKEGLKRSLEARGAKKVETHRFRIGVQRSGGRAPLVLDCAPAELPEQFRRVVTTVSADQDAIRHALAEGEAVPGARLGERSTFLSIR